VQAERPLHSLISHVELSPKCQYRERSREIAGQQGGGRGILTKRSVMTETLKEESR